MNQSLETIDPEIFSLINREIARQSEGINLIASENYAFRAVLEAMGTPLSNKYAEGYPSRRYYSGCQYIDEIENIAIERLKKLYKAEHANVQPHSGAQANMAVYFAFLKPGDTILTMNLNCGGHLTHGSPVNFSGQIYNVVHYGVSRKDELIDYDEVRELALKHRPKMIVAGASSYTRIIDSKAFKNIAEEVGAYFLFDMAHYSGLIAAGQYPSPVPHAHFVTSTTHKTLRGPRGGIILCKKEYSKDIDKSVFPGVQGGPLMHVIAAKAVAFKLAGEQGFVDYQKQVIKNARVFAETLQSEGFRIVSGGTDCHMVLVDLRNTGLTGKEAEEVLSQVGIYVNKNVVPFDPQPPRVTSGIRIGTAAITTRGMKEDVASEIAKLISILLKDTSKKDYVTKRVMEISQAYPVYSAGDLK
ncbi:MAG: serine hydroxymethyltransferase [Candidatus Calescibacterium sp.]|nr:serine hydroxymethyltransferase [Candidatus Calescibacterium sp.]MCX7971986.1 serine hydroxymethyltransferase [bacterium]MDW8195474.1 serine hydroxymethyltransferase [Candidatus Calescibacterium sp.]